MNVWIVKLEGGRATNEHGRVCGGLAGFNNRYFQGKGNVEAGMTYLESRAAGTLGVCCHASNEVDVTLLLLCKQAVYTKLY
ncbi:hypothetical protein [Microcoleus sp. Pol12B4]|uniref:hypothetical protein n=1 Tax=Microcoleus sp. Pol12B4 TaxID=3055395 RepID=UPI002FD465FE